MALHKILALGRAEFVSDRVCDLKANGKTRANNVHVAGDGIGIELRMERSRAERIVVRRPGIERHFL